jgi:hypothetical protein
VGGVQKKKKMLLSANRKNCVKLPYVQKGVGNEIGTVVERHVVLTYGNESVISLGDGEAMYTLWHGPPKDGGVVDLRHYNVPGLPGGAVMSAGKLIGLCIHQALYKQKLAMKAGSKKRGRGRDEVEEREHRDLETVYELFSSVGFNFVGFRRIEIGGDVSFVSEKLDVDEAPFELCDGRFKFWWTPAPPVSRRGMFAARRHVEDDIAEDKRVEVEVCMTFARISGGDFGVGVTGGLDAGFF